MVRNITVAALVSVIGTISQYGRAETIFQLSEIPVIDLKWKALEIWNIEIYEGELQERVSGKQERYKTRRLERISFYSNRPGQVSVQKNENDFELVGLDNKKGVLLFVFWKPADKSQKYHCFVKWRKMKNEGVSLEKLECKDLHNNKVQYILAEEKQAEISFYAPEKGMRTVNLLKMFRMDPKIE